jgi:foldase protein PrsA
MSEKASAVSVSTFLQTAAITITAAAAMFCTSCTKKETSKSIALTVNGQAITAAEVEEAAEFFQRQQIVASQIFEGGGDAYVRRAAARQLAANMLLLAEAKRLGWQADPVRINAAVERFIAQFPDREVFMSQLAAMGESEESMRRGMEEEFLLDSLLSTAGAAAGPVSDEECRAYYEANKERYKESGMARASHIVLELELTASDSQVRTAMDRAKEAAAKAKGGADFDALIKEYSPKAGGDIGWFKMGDLVPELEHKIFSMKKGEISEPMPSGMGIHILKKTDEKEPRQMSYEEAEAMIKAALGERKKAARVNAYVDSLIGAADVKYIDTTLVMRDTAR